MFTKDYAQWPLLTAKVGDVCIRIYMDGRGVQICFAEGGFMKAGLFRAAYKANDNDVFENGPVQVTVHVAEDEADADIAEVSMSVLVTFEHRKIELTLTSATCEEIDRLLPMAEASLSLYDTMQDLREPAAPRSATKISTTSTVPAPSGVCCSAPSAAAE